MFSLDQAMANWRCQQAESGACSPEVLDELESHLDQEIRSLVSGGASPADAFKTAVSRLGEPKSLTGELQKLSNRWPMALNGRVLLGFGVFSDRGSFQPVRTGLAVLAVVRELSAEQFQWRTEPYEFVSHPIAIDLLFGSDRERKALEAGRPWQEIAAIWESEEQGFLERRQDFLLYD